jgi:hypothetical protein
MDWQGLKLQLEPELALTLTEVVVACIVAMMIVVVVVVVVVIELVVVDLIAFVDAHWLEAALEVQ